MITRHLTTVDPPWTDVRLLVDKLMKYHRLLTLANKDPLLERREELDVHVMVLAPGETLAVTSGPCPNAGTEEGILAYACVNLVPDDYKEVSDDPSGMGGSPDITGLREKAERAISILANAYLDTITHLGDKWNQRPSQMDDEDD